MAGVFWTWFNEVYRRPGVSPALIDLQDRFGLNVNSLLYCAWLACQHAKLTRDKAGEAVKLETEWAELIVSPVRTARRELKTSPHIDELKRKDIRGRVQAIEIELEEVHVGLLELLTGAGEPQEEPEVLSELAADNLREYLAARKTASADIERITGSDSWRTLIKAISAD